MILPFYDLQLMVQEAFSLAYIYYFIPFLKSFLLSNHIYYFSSARTEASALVDICFCLRTAGI